MNKVLYLFGVLLLLSACTEEEQAPTFEVKPSTLAAKVGDTITFDIDSEAGFVSFYSGEFGNDYAFVGGRIVEAEGLDMFFQSRVNFGTQADQLRVLASTDFNNTYDVPSVKAATWVDITGRFSLGTTANVYRDSGTRDISDLYEEGKPLYLAFRYTTKPQAANGAGRTWTITNFSLKSMTEIGPQEVADQKSAGWTLVQEAEILDPGRSSVTSSGTINLRANNVNTELPTEFWAISKSFAMTDIDMGPDKSVPLKNMSVNNLKRHTHVYTKPGEYKAVFVAINESVYGQKKVLKEIPITVAP
ncbi:MAG: DUF5017 domain-containing protein [Adhaeribacter sp.]